MWPRAENIARYTGGRFNAAGDVNESPAPLPPGPPEPKIALPVPLPPPRGRVALLLHEDNLLAETLPLGGVQVAAIGGIAAPEARSPAGCAPMAAAWARGAMADGLNRATHRYGVGAETVEDAAAWAQAAGYEMVVTPYAPAGPPTG